VSHIGGGAKVTDTKSPGFGGYAYCLGHQKGIDGCSHERKEIVITRFGVVQKAPLVKPVEIGTKSKDNRGFGYHRLIEMERQQLLPDLAVAGHYNTVNLHISCCGSPASLIDDVIQNTVGDIFAFVFSYCSPLKKKTGIDFDGKKLQIIRKVNKFSLNG
jgi:hypothetical protein